MAPGTDLKALAAAVDLLEEGRPGMFDPLRSEGSEPGEMGEGTGSKNVCPVLSRIYAALAALSWPGRMEILSSEPFCMLDACIHPDSFARVREVIGELGISKADFLIGIPADKDYAGVVRAAYPYASRIFLTASKNPHYRFSENQKEKLAEEGICTEWTASVEEGLRRAGNRAAEDNLPLIILGTTSVVSEVCGICKK